MKATSCFSDDDLDAQLLALASTQWQKVAAIIAQVIIAHPGEDIENRAGKRIEALVRKGGLENAGDVRKWRFSEVRLPSV
jgi:hypothetical protein